MYESKVAGGIDGRRKRALSCFLHETDGFAISLTIISLPFFLAIAAWVIDASRVGNLHTDLQNAVDAMALAGARELDGRDDAIPRAQLAIAELGSDDALSNDAFFAGGSDGLPLGSRIDMIYDPADAAASAVVVRFLKSLPASDDDPIDLAVHEVSGTVAEQSNEALYAHVVAKDQSVQTIFPLGFAGRQTVAVNTEAVATYTAAACDVTPIYVCNPFEDPGGGSPTPATDIHANFAAGNLYARQMILRFDASNPPGPGNFGFLRTFGSGANVLAHALATGAPGVCFEEDGLDTEPGQNVGPVKNGLNTRMGLYGGSFGQYDNNPAYRPDMNVRKGQKQPVNGADCSNYDPEENHLLAMAFPEGIDEPIDIGGGSISATPANWDLDLYWDITHGGHTQAEMMDEDPETYPVGSTLTFVPAPNIATPSWPAAGVPPIPSRYDVYLHELQNAIPPNPPPLVMETAPNGENGAPICQGANAAPDLEDRRVVFAAVINCIDQQEELQGAATDIEAVAFARMFMTRPVETNGNERSIFLEMIDLTGTGGLGTVEELLREEAELVR